MQNLPIYLYANTFDVTLDLDTTVRGVNAVMYQPELKIQRGLKNTVRIQFKNSDQKRISVSTQTFIFSMYDALNQRLVLEKPLEVIETNTATRGLALLSLTESDTVDLDPSHYNFSVRVVNTDGTYSPAYSNTYYDVRGTAVVLNDVFPVLQPSQEIIAFNKQMNSNTDLYEHTSGNVYANPEYNSGPALHTMAVYMTGFRGTIRIQGTLSNTPASFGKYATVFERTYNQFTGIEAVNFHGIYSYIRLQFIPATKPGESLNDDPDYYGKLDKALYRS